MPTLLIVDDHKLILDSLELICAHSDLNFIIHTAQNTTSALKLIKTTPIDLMLLDLDLDGESGLDFLQQLKKSHRSVPCAILSASKNLSYAHKALNLGVLGFISKEHNAEQLLNAIKQILSNEIYLPKSHQQLLNNANHFNDSLNLTPRQMEIINHLKKGESNQQIADALHISITTVKSHIGTIFTTLNVSSRLECIQKSTQIGLISAI